MGIQYNGKQRAPELLLRQAEGTEVAGGGAAPPRVDVIRDRETLHCLYDNTRVPADVALRLGRALRDDGVAGGDADAAAAWPYAAGRPPPPDAALRTDAARGE